MGGHNEHILVCVTGQRNCERLIRHSAQLAQTLSIGKKCDISVIHVAGGNNRFMGTQDEGAALEYLFQISKAYNAAMTVMRNEDAAGTIAAFAKLRKVTRVVLGVPLISTGYDFAAELKGQMSDVQFHVIPYDVGSEQSDG